LETAVGATALAALAGCATRPRIVTLGRDAAPGVARLEISRPSRFTILQFTDLHFFAGDNGRYGLFNDTTVSDMRTLVALAKPDLLIVTGDLWRDNPPERLEEFMRYAVDQCASLGVPWAFAWGNHDQLKDFSVGHKALAEAKNSLYRGAGSDGNYLIDIVGRHRQVVWQILCINSDGDGIREPQQQWLRKRAECSGKQSPPRFAFFHIPLKQYVDIWNSGVAAGIKGEVPCIEKEDGSSLPILKSLGVRACFVGHDHVNDYSGAIDGVDLVYGRATGAGGYGGKVVPKGAKLITVNCTTGRYEWRTLLLDGKRWRPAPGERIEVTQ
jgi:hypothetical protein